MLEVGQTVPEFTLLDQTGREVSWSSLRGSRVVFFFYPRANTPGCTKEACAFRDLGADFGSRGVQVFGISADSVKKQANFDEKHGLGMPLLSDPEHVVIENWGVWGQKKMRGREYMGIVRTTILFDADGAVERVWSPVRVKGHAEAVLAHIDGGAA